MAEQTSTDLMDTATYRALPGHAVSPQWRQVSPVLRGRGTVLREPRLSDAPALMAALSSDEVGKFIASPPSTLEGYERFILWAREQRVAGESVCFVILPQGCDAPIGLFQI